jgi:hypothetical protein
MTLLRLLSPRWLAVLAASLAPLGTLAQQPIAPLPKLPAAIRSVLPAGYTVLAATCTLAARTDNAVYCVDCGGTMGDPFMNLVIKKGYFTVEHYGSSAQCWTRYVTFKYDPAARTWLLHRDGYEQFHATDFEHRTITATTAKDFGRVPLAKFDIYK